MSYTTISNFNFIQTFFADPEKVSGANEIQLTSVNLYFKNKPDILYNDSGKPSPGVTIAVCEVENNKPILSKVYTESIIRKSFDDIYAFADASSETSFGFGSAVSLQTNKLYGLMIIFEDNAYELWFDNQGETLVGTNVISSGSNLIKDGKLFKYNNTNIFTPINGSDLKFTINVAKYVGNTATHILTNEDYEFFTINAVSGVFKGGEWIYKATANATGNISIAKGNNEVIGDGTNFSTLASGEKIILRGNSTIEQVAIVNLITNATHMTLAAPAPFTNTNSKYMITPTGKAYYYGVSSNELFLNSSTANTTNYFDAGDSIKGTDSGATAIIESVNDFNMDILKIKGDATIPAAARMNMSVALTGANGNTYSYSNTNSFSLPLNSNTFHSVTNLDARILSRSQEVVHGSLYTLTGASGANVFTNKSVRIALSMALNTSANSSYYSPIVANSTLDMYVARYSINANTHVVDANGVYKDTEVDGNGTAKSRHISTKMTFANNKFAEDIRFYMTAYRPIGTNVQVYARVHNSADSDAFDDKSWTLLDYIENDGKYSSSTDRNDFVEYTLGLPQYSPSANALPGTFTTQLSNNVVVAQGVAPSSYLANNDVIKLYNPLIEEDYIIAVATSVNTTAIVLGEAISNNSVVGSGFNIDRVKYYNAAFNNITNDNVARYYNSSLVEFDTFDSAQFKIVMTSNSTYNVPRIDYYQAIGVSA
jgi:hypothetical protein